MDVIEAVRKRKSIRGYQSNPVPKEILSKMLDLARRSPSGMNFQTCEFIVLSGDSLEKVRRLNVESAVSGAEASADISGASLTASPYRERQVAVGKRLYELMGIARDDAEKRAQWWLKNLQFFGAPAVILICLDEKASENQMSLVDVGIMAHSITLIALEYGLGTCIQAAPVLYAGAVKKILDIPQTKRLILAVAVGYPDADFPANRLQSERASLDELVIWKD